MNSRRQLFSFQAKPYEAVRLSRLLRRASKHYEGAQDKLNAYWDKLCARYGKLDPERCQITIVAGWVFVHEYTEVDAPVICQL